MKDFKVTVFFGYYDQVGGATETFPIAASSKEEAITLAKDFMFCLYKNMNGSMEIVNCVEV